MAAFVRRFRTLPSLAELTSIEQIVLVDRTPKTPIIGVGTGTMMIVGEFEDGDFNTPTEVFGENDESQKFGGFGYTYGDQLYQNPCARRHLGEDWNGNGWIKGLNLKPPRKIICRVDTSVGDVRFTLAAALRSSRGPFDMEPADQLSVTTDTGGPASSTAVTAVAATRAGAGFAPGPTGFTGGERIGITIDSLTEVIVTFQAADQTAADVVSRINLTFGSVIAAVNAGEIDISSLQRGTGAAVTLRDVDAGTLAAIGHTAGTTNGTGNVANVDAVTPAEAANLINSGAIAAINAVAVVDSNTQEVIVYRTGSATGTIQINDVAGAMATDMGFTTATTITANVGSEFDVAAGTRVTDGSATWVTMRTITFAEGTVAAPTTPSTIDVEVRDATDDGSGGGALAGTVTTLTDYPSDRMVEVTNPGNLSVALTEAQIDAAYQTAFDATLDPNLVSRDANHVLCARRSEATIRSNRQNAIDASAEGNKGRIAYGRAPLGYSSSQAITDVALWRIDRHFYTWIGFKMTVSEIAALGTAGGTGFTADGEILIGADGPLAYLNCVLNPEENPGQDTQLLTFINGLEETGEAGTITLYKALKAAGICAPRVSPKGAITFQSEVTTSLIAGRKTQKRRKMADFVQDSLADAGEPYTKKLATDARRDGFTAALDDFLRRLKSVDQPDNQRIADYSVTETTDQYEGYEDLGVFVWRVQVDMLSSFDTIVFDTEIGEGVVVVTEA
jgi:hypothetical protein